MAEKDPDSSRQKSFMVVAGEYTALAFVLPSSTLAGWGIGYLLDGWFHTGFLKIVFLLLGIAAGLVQIIRKFTRDTRNSGNSRN